jgi:hypothetical protein
MSIVSQTYCWHLQRGQPTHLCNISLYAVDPSEEEFYQCTPIKTPLNDSEFLRFVGYLLQQLTEDVIIEALSHKPFELIIKVPPN